MSLHTKTRGLKPSPSTLPGKLVVRYKSVYTRRKAGGKVPSSTDYGSPSVIWDALYTQPNVYEELTGTSSPSFVKKKGSNKPKDPSVVSYNYVLHEKFEDKIGVHPPIILEDVKRYAYTYYYVDEYIQYTFTGPIHWRASFWTSDALTLPYTPTKSELSSAAKKMITDSNLLGLKDVGIPVMIAELKEISSLRNLLRLKGSIADNASDKLLGVSFGVIPLYGELKSLINIAENLEQRIRVWNESAKAKTVLNYHRTLKKEELKHPLPSHFYSQPVAGRPYSREILGYGYVKRTSVLSCYLVPIATDLDQMHKIVISILQISKVISSLWELVPFSFLIDWFVNIGDLIAELDYETPVLTYQVKGFGYSTKTESWADIKSKINVGSQTATQFVKSERRTIFKRQPLDLNTYLEPNFSDGLELSFDLSPMQTILGIALGHQHLRS